ncbi:MAG: Crp/Fnr family transcriptional regulator [Hyphomicrobiales bacterium]|nr:Crp/Fnr family transcriptional regulator [Hyphomicrobiales bacterium]
MFQTMILNSGLLREYERGDYVYHAGDETGGIYGVVHGAFGVALSHRGGSPRLTTVVRAPTWFGHGPLITGEPRFLSFRAMEPSLALQVPLSAVRRIAALSSENMASLVKLLNLNMSIVIDVTGDLQIARADRRIAATLLRSAGMAHDAATGQPDIWLSQSDLSEMANVSRQSVNTNLRSFEESGWVELGYERIRIRNAKELQSFAYGVEA